MSINTPELTLPQDFDWQYTMPEGSERFFRQNDVVATGRYRIASDGPIVTGANADIYKGIDQVDDNGTVALKIFSGKNRDSGQRGFQELRKQIALNGLEGIVKTVGAGVIKEQYPSLHHYLATLYADSTLGQFANSQASNTERVDTVLKMLPRVMRAITAMHRMGLIHRDIKPYNILRYDATDSWDLTDFGLAIVASEQLPEDMAEEANDIYSEATVTTAPFYGTPNYMAPEQFTDGSISSNADMFSMGVTIYHTLIGKLPFPIAPPYSSHKIEVHCKNIADQPPSELTQQLRTRDVPVQLGTLVASCLEYKPDNRPTDKELISGIEAV